jgi:hypothetical protein
MQLSKNILLYIKRFTDRPDFIAVPPQAIHVVGHQLRGTEEAKRNETDSFRKIDNRLRLPVQAKLSQKWVFEGIYT